jgi:hypothetical protein
MAVKCVSVLMVVGLIVGVSLVRGSVTGSKPDAPQTADFTKAVSLSIGKLQSTAKSPSDYKLTKVEMLLNKGKWVWRATYKPTSLLPQDPSRQHIGAGGEIFINIDLNTEQAEVTYGE